MQPLNSRITIEIKDKNNSTIETFELDTSAKTKKITLTHLDQKLNYTLKQSIFCSQIEKDSN